MRTPQKVSPCIWEKGGGKEKEAGSALESGIIRNIVPVDLRISKGSVFDTRQQ
jgi:hypothetical protein